MALITWNEKFSVNITEIDSQHKKLIELINELHEAMKVAKGQDVMGNILSELVNYTVYHFGTEEKLFQKHGYAEYITHKKEHDDLTKQVVAAADKFNKGGNIITVEVMNFLKDWLQKHILTVDKRYAPFLNSKGVV
jgi:hemerythrin-like metal-binding protein